MLTRLRTIGRSVYATASLFAWAFLCPLLLLSTQAISAASQSYLGKTTMQSAQVGNVIVQSAEAKYNLDTLLGDPTISGAFKYEASERLHYSTVAFLICQTAASPRYYVMLDPTIPDPGKGYGFNATGSPNWNKVFKLSASCAGDDYLDEATARAFWHSGFSVIGMLLVADRDEVVKDHPPGPKAKQVESASGSRTIGGTSRLGGIPTDTGKQSAPQQPLVTSSTAQMERIQEELRRQQEASAQRQRDLLQRQREAETQRQRQQVEAQERLEGLRRQSAEAERKRGDAAKKSRSEQDEKRAEAKRKADALAGEFARQNKEMNRTIDSGVREIQGVMDQLARSRAESRDTERRLEEERRQREEREEAGELRAKSAREQEAARREYEEEQKQLREEQDRIRWQAESERQQVEEQQRKEAAQRAKAKQLRMEAKENSLKNDGAAALKSLSKRPATRKVPSAFDALDVVAGVAATNKPGSLNLESGSTSTNTVSSAGKK